MLLYANVAVFALTATFAATLGVVALMYRFNLELSPRMAEEWPEVAAVTVVCWAMAIATGLGLWSLRRAWSGRWWLQGLSFSVVMIGALLIRRVLQV